MRPSAPSFTNAHATVRGSNPSRDMRSRPPAKISPCKGARRISAGSSSMFVPFDEPRSRGPRSFRHSVSVAARSSQVGHFLVCVRHFVPDLVPSGSFVGSRLPVNEIQPPLTRSPIFILTTSLPRSSQSIARSNIARCVVGAGGRPPAVRASTPIASFLTS
jgi:hypothetical protein